MSLIGASHFGTHRRPSPCYTATGHNPSYFFYSRPYRDCPTRCAFTTGVFPFFASPGLHTRSSRASGQIWESGPLLAAGAAVWDVWWDPPSDKVDGHSFRGLFPLASDSHLIRFVLSPSLSFSLSLHLHLHLTDSSFLSFSPQSCTYFAFLLNLSFLPSLISFHFKTTISSFAFSTNGLFHSTWESPLNASSRRPSIAAGWIFRMLS
jgi:hypothetical protein